MLLLLLSLLSLLSSSPLSLLLSCRCRRLISSFGCWFVNMFMFVAVWIPLTIPSWIPPIGPNEIILSCMLMASHVQFFWWIMCDLLVAKSFPGSLSWCASTVWNHLFPRKVICTSPGGQSSRWISPKCIHNIPVFIFSYESFVYWCLLMFTDVYWWWFSLLICAHHDIMNLNSSIMFG